MTEEQDAPRRRRRRRGGRGRGGRSRAPAAPGPPSREAARPERGRAQASLPDWRWATFPVFLAFVSGMVVMGLFASAGRPLGLVVFVAALFGFAFGAAHLLTRLYLARRR